MSEMMDEPPRNAMLKRLVRLAAEKVYPDRSLTDDDILLTHGIYERGMSVQIGYGGPRFGLARIMRPKAAVSQQMMCEITSSRIELRIAIRKRERERAAAEAANLVYRAEEAEKRRQAKERREAKQAATLAPAPKAQKPGAGS